MIGKNQEFELEITDLSEDGLGIGRKDGFVWFVKDSAIGDRVRVSAMKVKKRYGFARLRSVLRPSRDRVESPCPISRRCGGCQLMEMSYAAQLRFKQDKVYRDLLRIGGVEEDVLKRTFEDIVGMESPIRYRNKAQFPISVNKEGRLTAGFYAGRTHAVIACEDCLLGASENALLLRTILDWAERYGIEAYHEESGTGLLRHVLLRKGFRSGEQMVCLVVNSRSLPHSKELVTALTSGKIASLSVRSVSYSIHTGRDNVIMGRELVNLYGPGYIEDSIGQVRFRVSPLSFYQVNPVQTERIYATVLEFAALSGRETVWDMYCGIGTISLFLSQKAGKVYGVEIVPEAVRDARENAERNGITNTEFFAGAAEEVLPAWYAAHPEEQIDVVCVDPPRRGLEERALETSVKALGTVPDGSKLSSIQRRITFICFFQKCLIGRVTVAIFLDDLSGKTRHGCITATFGNRCAIILTFRHILIENILIEIFRQIHASWI